MPILIRTNIATCKALSILCRCQLSQAAAIAKSVTSYFTTISKEEYLAQATSTSSGVLPAAPRKEPVGHPRKVFTNNELEKRNLLAVLLSQMH